MSSAFAPGHQRSPAAYANTGFGPQFSVIDIGLTDRVAVIEPDTAFWAVVRTDALPAFLRGEAVASFVARRDELVREMEQLRFGIKPSAVYLNPTERCNFNCSYCYIPADLRRSGHTMSAQELLGTLDTIERQYRHHLPAGVRPQVIFHGSEPLIARDAVFEGIAAFNSRIQFGVQTNASLLDDTAIDFLRAHRVSIGISLDAPDAATADSLRATWDGSGAYAKVMHVIEALHDYEGFSVITTVTRRNVDRLVDMVDFYHKHGVGLCMLNPVRCTQPGGLDLKPDDQSLARAFMAALDRTWENYQASGRKTIVANFANVLAGIMGPTTRRLMCDISPCGGGRCFVAVAANGDVFPCSEFVGLSEFRSGNIHRDSIETILAHPKLREISDRRVERFAPCSTCSIRHFCGAPCPAELHAVRGSTQAEALYCHFYEEQARYALRVLAEGRQDAYMWNGWEGESDLTIA